MIWQEYWVWIVAAFVLGILEILSPGFILLGFAIGALVIGGLLFVGGTLGDYLAGSLPILLMAFAALSLVSWILMRRIFGVRKGQIKIWDEDINER
ncbi:MAG: hypothetical protein JXR14_15810 [Paracoccaceae bacterium]